MKKKLNIFLLNGMLIGSSILSLNLIAYKSSINKNVKNTDTINGINQVKTNLSKSISFDQVMKYIGKTMESFIEETKIDLTIHSESKILKLYNKYINDKINVSRVGENKIEHYWYWFGYWRWYFTWYKFAEEFGLNAVPNATIASYTVLGLAKVILPKLALKFGVGLAIPGIGKLIAAAGLSFALSVAGPVIGHRLWEEPTASRGIAIAFTLTVFSGSWKQ